MLRPFWLGLILLFAVGGLAAAKFAVPSVVANVPAPSKPIKQTERFISPTEVLTTVGTSLLHQAAPEPPLTKTDKLAARSAEPVPIKTIPVGATPSRKPQSEAVKEPVKIVSRHWRDPLAPKLPSHKAAKSKSTKTPSKPSL